MTVGRYNPHVAFYTVQAVHIDFPIQPLVSLHAIGNQSTQVSQLGLEKGMVLASFVPECNPDFSYPPRACFPVAFLPIFQGRYFEVHCNAHLLLCIPLALQNAFSIERHCQPAQNFKEEKLDVISCYYNFEAVFEQSNTHL